MQKKWLFTLLLITSVFMLYSFFIESPARFAYLWMTMGVSLVSFIFYYIVTTSNKKDSQKMIGGNLSAIVLKFILSAVVVILYIIFHGIQDSSDMLYFFIAYIIFSVVNYAFSYNYKDE